MSKTKELQTLIVGAGPAGLTAARELLGFYTEKNFLVLESGERRCGRFFSGLHLVNEENPCPLTLKKGPRLNRAKIRWDRKWVLSEEVDWTDKEWLLPNSEKLNPGQTHKAAIPQWNFYLNSDKALCLDLEKAFEELPLKDQSPVSRIEERSSGGWKVEVAEITYECQNLIWAAGLQAFQNAFGKFESQVFLSRNPSFVSSAQDYRGGIGLEIELSLPPQAEEGFDFKSVFALPVKHDGKRFLLIGAFEENTSQEVPRWILHTLTHAPQELLVDHKELLSLQKSLKRGLKGILSSVSDKDTEKWVVSSHVGAHVLGSPWLLKSQPERAIYFIGEESEDALSENLSDTLGALNSAYKFQEIFKLKQAAWLQQNLKTDPSEESIPAQTHKEKKSDLSL